MAEPEDARPAIGIDLGTTNSRVGIWLDGENRFELISNDHGHSSTPSYVAFTETERLIGDAAKDQVSRNPANTVFDAKRLIGRKFSELGTDADEMHVQWPFKVTRGKDDKPMIHVEYKGKEKVFSAMDMGSMVLGKMKDLAEVYSGSVVDEACVSVPHCFTSAQRQATRSACSLAGFEAVTLVSEPVCAALAYSLRTIGPLPEEKMVMIFDLGGGSLDVTLFSIEEGVIEVKAASGDSQLGGEDFDLRLLHHFIQEIEQKYERDITSHPRVVRRLKKQVERVKVALSSDVETTVQIDALLEDFDFYSSVSRACFEKMNLDLFEKCIQCVEECLQCAELDKADVYEVVLVGGSSRIPKLQELLAEFFNDKSKLNLSIGLDEAVVCGAAARAGISRGCTAFADYLVVDVIPLSLGLETVEGAMHVMHPRHSSIPRSSEQLFTTVHDDQPGVIIQVYEGENSQACDNILIATIELSGIPPVPRGVPQILVRFDVDAYGILTVSAKDKTTGEKVEVYMDQEVDSARVHHDDKRRQGLPVQVYHPAEKPSDYPSSSGSLEPSNISESISQEFSNPSPTRTSSITIESTSQEFFEPLEACDYGNIAESESQKIPEPPRAFESSDAEESKLQEISAPPPSFESSIDVENSPYEFIESTPTFESINTVELGSQEFFNPPQAFELSIRAIASETMEKSSEEFREPPQEHESSSTLEAKSEEFPEPAQASEPSIDMKSSSSVQEILDTIHEITPISDFKAYKRECSTFIRRVNMLVPLFEEFRDLELPSSEEILTCFNSLEAALNTAKDLLLLCSQGCKLWLIFERHNVAVEFRSLNMALVQALHELPHSLGISDEVREQVDLVHTQLKRSKALEDAVDAQLSAELISIMETHERSPDHLTRLAESFKLTTASALRKEFEALDGVTKEKARLFQHGRGLDEIFELLSALRTIFPAEDSERDGYAKPPDNVKESSSQKSSSRPSTFSNGTEEFSAQPPQVPDGIDGRSLESSEPALDNRDANVKAQEFLAPTYEPSHSFEGRPPHKALQLGRFHESFSSRSSEFAEPSPKESSSGTAAPESRSEEFPEYSSKPDFPDHSPANKPWNGLEGKPPEPSTHRTSSSSGCKEHAPSELDRPESRRHEYSPSHGSSFSSEVSSGEFSGSGSLRAIPGTPELCRSATTADEHHPPRPENARSASCPQIRTSNSIIEDVVKKYTWEQVLDMTNGLSKTIGKGGFGAVYLGKLETEKDVAVKILDASSQQGITEFLNEVNLLKRVNHVNLVRLLGYCLDEKQVLIYEFAEEGSIWDHLQVGGKTLDWKTRLKVALESACGLEYLHMGCHPKIIHRDIKSQNILLTKAMVAKVADFGLSKLGADQDNVSKTHVTTMVKGTLGYLDPEYLKTGQLTEKSDVYSFGVVLLEIVTGRKPIQNTDKRGFIGDWVEDLYNSSNNSSRHLKHVVDPTMGSQYNSKALKLVVNVAKECIHPYGMDRPEMTQVVHVLRKAQMIEHDEKKSSKWLPFL